MVKATLPNKSELITLVDSGATTSVISGSAIQSNPYLRAIKKEASKLRTFIVGNGETMTSNEVITFKVDIQGHILKITFQVVNSLGGLDALVGTKSLTELGASLDFATHRLKFKSRSVPAKLLMDVTLKPGETKMVLIRAKVPKVLRHAEVYVQTTSFMQKLTARLMLVRLYKYVTEIPVKNMTNRVVHLKTTKPIGSVLLYNFGKIPLEKEPDWLSRLASVSPEQQDNTVHGERSCQLLAKQANELYSRKIKKYPYLEKEDKRLSQTDIEVLNNNIDLSKCECDRETKGKLTEILKINMEAFSLHDELGIAKDQEVNIELVNEEPFYIRPFPVSETEKEFIDKEVKKLVQLGILTPSRGSYVSPMMLLKKKVKPGEKQTYRLICDLRYVNSRIRPRYYCSPLLRDSIKIIGHSGAKIFSCVDIKGAFHSLNIEKGSQKYLHTCPYPGGTMYRYQKLAMGLKVSPSEWGNCMDKILGNLKEFNKNIVVYTDDILIFSETHEEHLTHIKHLLEVLAKNGLKIAPSKCEFFRKEVKYIGHVLKIDNGKLVIKAQKDKVEAIQNLPVPKTSRQVKRFIGMVTYLSEYCPDLQMLISPLHKIARKGCKFIWTEIHQSIFEKVKLILASQQVLALPTKGGQFKLHVDSSVIGMGSMLVQVQNGKERVLSFYSKCFPESAKRYSISELELFGIWIAIKAFRHMLRGNKFQVVSDHSSLVQIVKSKTEIPSQRLKKILEKMLEYNFDLVYKKGSEHVIPDFLSRCPHAKVDDDDPIAFSVIGDVLMGNMEAEIISSGGASLYQANIRSDANINPNDPHKKAQVRNICPCCGHNGLTNVGELGSSLEDNLRPVITRAERARAGGELMTGVPAPTRAKRAAPAPVLAGGAENIPGVRVDANAVEEGRVNIPIPDFDQPMQQHEGLEEPVQAPVNRFLPEVEEDGVEDEEFLFDSGVDKHQNLGMENIEQQERASFNIVPKEYFSPELRLCDKLNEDQWYYRHIPKGKMLTKQLKAITSRYVANLHLPLEKQAIAKEQRSDPFFRPIYQYIMDGTLPNRRVEQKRIMSQSEEYMIVDTVLFRVDVNERTEQVTTRVCIPTSILPVVLDTFHNSIISCHIGINRLFLQLRRIFFIVGLFSHLIHFVRSCTRCQALKHPREPELPYQMNIPNEYKPFEEIHLDIKHMMPGMQGYRYILVGTCSITRYMIAIPLKKADSKAVAEGLLKIIFTYGPPRKIKTDLGPEMCNELTAFLTDALKIKIYAVSPFNHQGLRAERAIQTLANYLKSNLTEKGRDWPLYVSAAAYAYNTQPTMATKYSPFYLMFLRSPETMPNLQFRPVEEMKSTYQEYVEFLKVRLNAVGQEILKLEAKRQVEQAVNQAQKVKCPNKYAVGTIVYLLAPTLSDLITTSRKFVASYIGPLVIRELVSTDKALLSDLEGKKLTGVFHFKRLKIGYIRIPGGSTDNIEIVRKELNKVERAVAQGTPIDPNAVLTPNPPSDPMSNEPRPLFCNNVQEVKDLKPSLNHQNDNVNKSPGTIKLDWVRLVQLAERNGALCSSTELREHELASVVKQNACMPGDGSLIKVKKAKYEQGQLNVLFTTEKQYEFWVRTQDHPYIAESMLTFLKDNKIRTEGSIERFVRQLYLV
jgi:hypothetical protein